MNRTLTQAERIAALTPEQRLSEAIKAREFYWRKCQDLDEDARIEKHIAACIAICGGDKAAGERLSREAFYA